MGNPLDSNHVSFGRLRVDIFIESDKSTGQRRNEIHYKRSSGEGENRIFSIPFLGKNMTDSEKGFPSLFSFSHLSVFIFPTTIIILVCQKRTQLNCFQIEKSLLCCEIYKRLKGENE